MSDRISRLRVLRHPAGWLGSGFGAGLSPIAPGTVGSAAALVPYLALRTAEPVWQWAAIVATFFIGVRCARWIIDTLGEEDPGVVTLDEFVGQWITLALMELAAHGFGFELPPVWLLLAIGFFAFRICDILKPWPASWADQKLHGGFGAMADDALAGVWAGAAGTAVLWAMSRYL